MNGTTMTELDELLARADRWLDPSNQWTFGAEALVTELAAALRAVLAAQPQADKPQAEDALFKGTLSQLRSRLDGVYLPGTEWHPDTLVMVYVEAVMGSAAPTCPTCQLVDCYCAVAGSVTPTGDDDAD